MVQHCVTRIVVQLGELTRISLSCALLPVNFTKGNVHFSKVKNTGMLAKLAREAIPEDRPKAEVGTLGSVRLLCSA